MLKVQQNEYGRSEMPLPGSEAETQTLLGSSTSATQAWEVRRPGQRLAPATAASDFHDLGGDGQDLARVVDNWFSDVLAEGEPLEPWAGMPWAAEWENCAADTGEQLRQLWAGRVEASQRVVGAQLEADPNALDSTHLA